MFFFSFLFVILQTYHLVIIEYTIWLIINNILLINNLITKINKQSNE